MKPWHVVTGPHVADSDGRSLAMIQNGGYEPRPDDRHRLQRWGRSDAELKEIANIIAAAPEMLQALDEFLRCGPNAGHNRDLLSMVETVVAKARGEK